MVIQTLKYYAAIKKNIIQSPGKKGCLVPIFLTSVTKVLISFFLKKEYNRPRCVLFYGKIATVHT